jgi:type I restriction enzyme S subunit
VIPTTDIVATGTPTGWRTVPFWFLFRRQKETGFPEEELLSVYRDYGVIPKSSRDDNHNKESEDLSGYQLVTEGALVTNKMKAWQGSIAISRYRGIVSPAYYVYTPQSDECDQFLHYLLRSTPYIGLYGRISKGVRVNQWDLEHEALRNIPVLLPDVTAQRAIADFLDRETARIDVLIEKKQRLVALLGEKYEATAAQLSTGKLSQEEKYDSGIDWLGDIPKSWSVEKLSWHFYAAKGKDAQKYTKEYCGANEGDYPVYSGQTANEGVMGRIETYDYDFGETGVLFATTVGAKAMDLRHLKGKFSLSQNCMIIIPRHQISLQFYLYQMRVLFRKERQLIPDHMQASFRVEDLYQYRIALPPLDQASAIGMRIQREEEALKRVVQPVTTSIDRLKEYRSALITVAVTGQINVAEWGKAGTNERQLDAIQAEMDA